MKYPPGAMHFVLQVSDFPRKKLRSEEEHDFIRPVGSDQPRHFRLPCGRRQAPAFAHLARRLRAPQAGRTGGAGGLLAVVAESDAVPFLAVGDFEPDRLITGP